MLTNLTSARTLKVCFNQEVIHSSRLSNNKSPSAQPFHMHWSHKRNNLTLDLATKLQHHLYF